MVPGVRIHGDKVDDVEVALDDKFWPVPVANELGIPLVYKTRPGTGGDDSHIRNNVIVPLMADPETGFAPAEWQYGGRMGPAPPVVLARRDSVPFSWDDWATLNEFMDRWFDQIQDRKEAEEAREEEQARGGEPRSPLPPLLSPEIFRAYVRRCIGMRPATFLVVQFPIGSTVVAEGLSTAALNGVEGIVERYSRDRVGVKFPDRDEPLALRPERLRLVREPALAEHPTKKQNTGPSKEERQIRQKALERQEAQAISKRFVDCLVEDTFPEQAEVHLFGLGSSDYQFRNNEVLGVWQGAVKGDLLQEGDFAEALEEGTMPELFKETCYKLAASKNRNQPYAQTLIDNKFAAVEWDTL